MAINIKWCLRQKKGIKLVQPSRTIAKDYIVKAHTALSVAEASLHNKAYDWVIIASYYARYDAAYALLMTIGIKSEIHECTILLLKDMFIEQKLISTENCDELLKAKEDRIDAQYYVKTPIRENLAKTTLAQAQKFVLAMEESLEKISDDLISNIRSKI